ncbi:phage distal tail protein, Rcc01695 family [Rickettsia endosymbiont of Cardiosporidium cionae]|uniref:phage distal tail protein, Rcc01695 family n=1 Tax=Rickettsia endosymbiont of Cardiosporidium cionae TaxID=2777155 RepID=UPI00189461AE|nr:TIGR02217 family protein [Rickettsia endosymbiont of Cardiosporidium cionae]KAF8818802.1 TIGR02217 family protein [Rickettsia endosymbiont of Cardiosporidium cionae]
MNIHNTKLPDFITIFAIASPNFSTSCVQSASGREVRNSDTSNFTLKYLIRNARLSQEEFYKFNSFFIARGGKRFAFLFKDLADYKISNQYLATGDGVTRQFQLYKQYDDEFLVYRRKITKPIQNSVKIYNKSSLVPVEVNYDQGIITLSEPCNKDDILTANFEFYVPVRFNCDNFQYKINRDDTIQLSDIEIIEVND